MFQLIVNLVLSNLIIMFEQLRTCVLLFTYSIFTNVQHKYTHGSVIWKMKYHLYHRKLLWSISLEILTLRLSLITIRKIKVLSTFVMEIRGS